MSDRSLRNSSRGHATLCASGAGVGTSGSSATATTGVAAPSLDTAACADGTAVNLYVGVDTDSSIVKWHASSFPGLTMGNVSSLSTNVLWSADVAGDQPFYVIAFYATDNGLGAGTDGQLIELLEDQSGNLSGGNMAMNANSTLFDVYDYSTDSYLPIADQQHPATLDGLLALDSGISSDAVYALDIEIGVDGGCANPSACSESLTVNAMNVNPPAATPEPEPLVMVGSGLLFVTGALALKRRQFAL